MEDTPVTKLPAQTPAEQRRDHGMRAELASLLSRHGIDAPLLTGPKYVLASLEAMPSAALGRELRKRGGALVAGRNGAVTLKVPRHYQLGFVLHQHVGYLYAFLLVLSAVNGAVCLARLYQL